jgi:hypothetical protein
MDEETRARGMEPKGRRAALALLAAPLAEIRRKRGEGRATPEALLAELREFDPNGYRDYVLFTMLALDTLASPQGNAGPRPTPPPRHRPQRPARFAAVRGGRLLGGERPRRYTGYGDVSR